MRECVPPSERLLVLWFAPDIYYYSGRLMAQRHLVFIPEWSSLEGEQQNTLDKVRRFAPPVVLAQRSSLDGDAKASYPGVVNYVAQAYDVAASVADDGEEYLVLARRDRPPVRRFGDTTWPCYTSEPSSWWRIGHEPR